jgi:uncharacterized protein (TIGR00369 family)
MHLHESQRPCHYPYAHPYTWPDMAETEIASTLQALARSPENPCFVCSHSNPVGLHVEFELRDSVIRAQWTPQKEHQGWQGVVHGGVLAALLDEAMAYTLFTQGCMGMTGRMEIRYRSPARAGEVLSVEARCVRETSKIADIEAEIAAGGRVVAAASARFVKVGTIDPISLFRPAP